MSITSAEIKKAIHQLHLWLGLSVGVLFFVIAFSGALFTWESEFAQIIYHQKVEAQEAPFTSVSRIKSSLHQAFPEGDFRAVVFRGRTRAAQVLVYAPGTYYHAFMNPYSGDLIHLQNMKQGWLNHLKNLHRNLMLGEVGREIVHWVTLISLLMLLTGLVLWWPNNRAGRKQRFTLKWTSSPKRLNYDLHNVLGFYVTWIAILSIVTGLFWGFEVLRQSLRSFTQEDHIQYDKPISDEGSLPEVLDQASLVDSLTAVYLASYPDKAVRVSDPHSETDPIAIVLITDGLVYNTEHHYFDRYTGQRILGNHEYGEYEASSSFHIINGLVYDIHLGTIGGWFGKLVMCIASLILASLPITGFVIWWGKRKRA